MPGRFLVTSNTVDIEESTFIDFRSPLPLDLLLHKTKVTVLRVNSGPLVRRSSQELRETHLFAPVICS